MMNSVGFLFGLTFGALLGLAGLNNYDTIHQMLLLRNAQPYLIMASAIAVAVPGLWLLQRSGWISPFGGSVIVSRAAIERKHVLGAVVFGTGWAIAGTCPAPALAMVGSGAVLGLIVAGGLFTGVWLRDQVAERVPSTPVLPQVDSEPAKTTL